jgi:DsbC/DsbD-like thiol-disulfide interchange protein
MNRRQPLPVAICFLAMLGVWYPTFASAQMSIPTDIVDVQLLADTAAVEAGKPFELGVLLTIKPKWHIYWINPGDAGDPTTVTWQLPPGFTAGPLKYPTPVRFEQEGPVISFGYEDRVLLASTITPPAELRAGETLRFAADAAWMSCETVCYPGSGSAALELPVGVARASEKSEIFARMEETRPVVQPNDSKVVRDARIVSTVGASGGELTVTIDWADEPPAGIDFFPPAIESANWAHSNVETSDRRTVATVSVRPLSGRQLAAGEYHAVIGYDIEPGQRRGVALTFTIAGQ